MVPKKGDVLVLARHDMEPTWHPPSRTIHVRKGVFTDNLAARDLIPNVFHQVRKSTSESATISATRVAVETKIQGIRDVKTCNHSGRGKGGTHAGSSASPRAYLLRSIAGLRRGLRRIQRYPSQSRTGKGKSVKLPFVSYQHGVRCWQ